MRLAWVCLAWLAFGPASAGESDDLLMQGQALRRAGDLDAAIATLARARTAADRPESASRAATALGAAYLQARRLAEAEEALAAGYHPSAGPARAAAALELGNLAAARKQNERAEALYRETVRLADSRSADAFAARVNLARLEPPAQRLPALVAIHGDLSQLPDLPARGLLLLHLGQLALDTGPAGTALAYTAFEQARQLAAREPASRGHIAALDALGRLYESQGRWSDATALSAMALDAARAAPPRPLQDLLLDIEWRQARAHRQAGRNDLALAASTRAVEHAQAIRPDMPIELPDGRSTYQAVLQPVLEMFVELQLDALAATPAERQPGVLLRVRDMVEAMRQAEMQDFLGDRCTVDEGEGARLEAGVIAVYPILLKDRLETLVETRDGVQRFTTPIARSEVVAAARTLARALRDAQPGYLASAQRLYDWLIRPLEGRLAGMHTLVVVPDGALRLVPFAVLHDGKASLVEGLAVATVTGMSMTDSTRPMTGRRTALLAGVSEPGPVVEKLAVTDILRPASGAGTGRERALRSAARALSQREADDMRKSLALPGVREEVAAIARTLDGHVLLDQSFTLSKFESEAEGGDYRIVHIASHGVFGGTAETSFILAYDDLLGINRLQGMLRSEKVLQAPIDLLTLSACETAEGNDRAPLGIAGAAIRARARSVLGTLWAVDDEAARTVMDLFYQGIASGRMSKAAALREAQLAVMKQPATRHPVFWGPFNLVGNWR